MCAEICSESHMRHGDNLIRLKLVNPHVGIMVACNMRISICVLERMCLAVFFHVQQNVSVAYDT